MYILEAYSFLPTSIELQQHWFVGILIQAFFSIFALSSMLSPHKASISHAFVLTLPQYGPSGCHSIFVCSGRVLYQFVKSGK